MTFGNEEKTVNKKCCIYAGFDFSELTRDLTFIE